MGPRSAPHDELAAGLGIYKSRECEPDWYGAPAPASAPLASTSSPDAQRPRPVHTIFIDRSQPRKIDRGGMGRDFSSPNPGTPGPRGRAPISGLCCRSAPSPPPAPQVPGFISVFNCEAGSAQAGAAAPGGGTRRRGPAPLLSLACKYLLPRWKSDYFARAPLAKSLSKHAQMTAPGGRRHVHSPCTGLVTL